MKIQSVSDPSFAVYGQVHTGCDISGILKKLVETTEKPMDRVIYVPSDATLESDAAFAALRDRIYGGMPIQIGYCNGSNTKLNCVEYHRDSEINIPADDMVFLLARQQDVVDGKLDTSRVEAFLAPAGSVVELYATSLHYAPCDAKKGQGFRVAVVLPRGTNTEKPAFAAVTPEDQMLMARNKWLIAHPEANEAGQGAHVGLTGVNTDIAEWIK